jgi:predicted DNA-binding transcriptional regulator YafY
MSLLERIYFFHEKLQDRRYPNASTLADQFEVSLATARRDISYLRDRLLAPLAFDQQKNGFYYDQEGFALPFERSPKIIFLLGMLNKMAEEAGLGQLPEVKTLEEKLSSFVFPEYGRLVDNIHCEWVEVETLQPLIFETIIEAIVTRHVVTIVYNTTSGEGTERALEPQRLINYQGRWYLLAFCRLRKAERIFHLARMSTAELDKDTFETSNKDHETLLRQSFGIFKGKTIFQAEILFTSTAAELVRHQHWHSQQTIEETGDGVILRLPVSDTREILMKVLQYGSMAQVIGPPTLKKQVQEEIQKMSGLYA